MTTPGGSAPSADSESDANANDSAASAASAAAMMAAAERKRKRLEAWRRRQQQAQSQTQTGAQQAQAQAQAQAQTQQAQGGAATTTTQPDQPAAGAVGATSVGSSGVVNTSVAAPTNTNTISGAAITGGAIATSTTTTTTTRSRSRSTAKVSLGLGFAGKKKKKKQKQKKKQRQQKKKMAPIRALDALDDDDDDDEGDDDETGKISNKGGKEGEEEKKEEQAESSQPKMLQLSDLTGDGDGDGGGEKSVSAAATGRKRSRRWDDSTTNNNDDGAIDNSKTNEPAAMELDDISAQQQKQKQQNQQNQQNQQQLSADADYAAADALDRFMDQLAAGTTGAGTGGGSTSGVGVGSNTANAATVDGDVANGIIDVDASGTMQISEAGREARLRQKQMRRQVQMQMQMRMRLEREREREQTQQKEQWEQQLSGSRSGGVITAEELVRLQNKSGNKRQKVTERGDVSSSAVAVNVNVAMAVNVNVNVNINGSETQLQPPIFTASDWESDVPGGGGGGGGSKMSEVESASEAETETETDNEEEEKARHAFLQALKSATESAANAAAAAADESATASSTITTTSAPEQMQIKAEVQSEKHRREEHIKRLEQQAAQARKSAHEQAETDFGRIYNDDEGGVMEESQRQLEVLTAAPDALEVLAELNKKKELKAVDHTQIDYLPIRKNLFVVPRSLANLTPAQIEQRRAEMQIRVRGKGAPAPITNFRECGLSERILAVLESQSITKPFPVQSQCLPCILGGRDVIGIAKTGSGKTLAYLLPMLRHILDQPPLEVGESGPIGLVLAPARELAFQIHSVCKVFAKHLGLKSTAVYGGAGVKEQIGDLKRGTHIVVATPGRMIDILTMQSGKLLSLRRVSYVVMDEADRLFDMGFAPQLSAILSAVRPDRQTVLFSATFPKSVENLARKSLKYPIEVLVGGRSVVSDTVTQYGEVVEEEDKFLRLLQVLGEHINDEDDKCIVFVDTQLRADNVFEQLLPVGYPALSLHGGKDQEDRDSTISDFKRSDGPNILVATSVAGRGLDVPACRLVVNYSAPNHLEDYVHRCGRTGRAGKLGTAYTFVNSVDESKFAPSVVRAMMESGMSKNVSQELSDLAQSFQEKVKAGTEKRAGSGFQGRGYTYDSSELSEAQKLAKMEKKQALIEAGLIDADDDEPAATDMDDDAEPFASRSTAVASAGGDAAVGAAAGQPAKISAELLALPGMHDMMMSKAGFGGGLKDGEPDPATGIRKTSENHYVAEIEINDYPQQARWRTTNKETSSRLQDDFNTAVTLKGSYFPPSKEPAEGERKLYLHLEAVSEHILKKGMHEMNRLLNEETLKAGAKGGGSHKYSVL